MSPTKSSNVAEVREEVSMADTSTEIVDSSSLGKRKSEDSDTEEDEESDEIIETDEESESETEPVWGYDSFEDKEYLSFSEGELADAFSDQESVKPFLDCRRQIHSSRGFDVDPNSIPDDMITGYFPIDLNDTLFGWPDSPDGTARGYMELMVGLALDKYKQKEGVDVKMEYVVRAIARKSAGIKCYITFMARETLSDALVEYQAKTEWKIGQVHTYPIFCRPSPPPVDLKGKSRTRRPRN